MRKLRHLGEMRLGVSPKRTIKDIHREKRERSHKRKGRSRLLRWREVVRDSRRKRESNDPYSVVIVRYRRERGGGTASGHQSER